MIPAHMMKFLPFSKQVMSEGNDLWHRVIMLANLIGFPNAEEAAVSMFATVLVSRVGDERARAAVDKAILLRPWSEKQAETIAEAILRGKN